MPSATAPAAQAKRCRTCIVRARSKSICPSSRTAASEAPRALPYQRSASP